MNWNRKLWGVEFVGKDGSKRLIGSLWYHEYTHIRKCYAGEPTRALLFTTRKLAREWCQRERRKYTLRSDDLRFWRFRPVRVRETAKVI